MELINRDDVDAATSPDFTHQEYAIAALNAGKHIFCERPIAITMQGCNRILAHKSMGQMIRGVYLFSPSCQKHCCV
jgi:predicted dehydrogenase